MASAQSSVQHALLQPGDTLYALAWLRHCNNAAFADANPAAVRLDPDRSHPYNESSLNNHSYVAREPCHAGAIQAMPRANVNVTVYIPHYYAERVNAAPLALGYGGNTKVEIRNNGTTYAGGPERVDCADR
jgi:hypothetical protein